MSYILDLPKVSDPLSGYGGWRVIVLNDDHNTFDHVAHMLARYIPDITVESGYTLANTIHTSGQATVWDGHREAAELYWEQLYGAGLTLAPLEGS